MMVGTVIKERMDSIGFTKEDLVEKSGLSVECITSILDDKMDLQIDDFEASVIAQTILCSPEYLFDAEARSHDVLCYSCNRGTSTVGSNLIKARMQSFVMDYLSIQSI